MYYKRALSCYTSIITNAKTKQATLFNWREGEALRGVNEMIQVWMNFIDEDDEISGCDFSEDNCSVKAVQILLLICMQPKMVKLIQSQLAFMKLVTASCRQIGTINTKLCNHKSKLETLGSELNLMTERNRQISSTPNAERWLELLVETRRRPHSSVRPPRLERREPLHQRGKSLPNIRGESPSSIFISKAKIGNTSEFKSLRMAHWWLQDQDMYDDDEDFNFKRPFRFCDEWMTPEQLSVLTARFQSD